MTLLEEFRDNYHHDAEEAFQRALLTYFYREAAVGGMEPPALMSYRDDGEISLLFEYPPEL